MNKTDELLKKLAERIAAAPERVHKRKVTEGVGMDRPSRESYIRAIKGLVRAYRPFGFQLLVDQATLGRSGICDLEDEELIELHRSIDRARECVADDVTFEDAGLLRTLPSNPR